MEDLIRELARRHNDDVNDLAAWVLGYINQLENRINAGREALGCEPLEMTLIENLKQYVADKDT